MHLDPFIQVAYVREALRLLQKSIIHVETEDIELEENEENMNRITQHNAGLVGMEADTEGATEGQQGQDDSVPSPSEQQAEQGVGSKRARESLMGSPSPSKRPAAATEEPEPVAAAPAEKKKKEKLKISADEYARLTTMILLYLKRQEMLMTSEQPEDEGAETNADADNALRGTKRADIIAWYLEEVSLKLLTVSVCVSYARVS